MFANMLVSSKHSKGQDQISATTGLQTQPATHLHWCCSQFCTLTAARRSALLILSGA
jgi:hypothetical protein